MVIVLKNTATEEDKRKIKEFLAQKNFKTNELPGEEETIIAAVGKMGMDPHDLALFAGVERVIPISKPYKMASREFKKDDTVIQLQNNRSQIIRIGGQRIVSIAGPCAIENEQQMNDIAKAVAASGACMLRGGAYKPRTSPYAFQGLGEEGLVLLKKYGDKYGLPVVTECVSQDHLPLMKKHGIDMIQIGARNMQNFELLKKVGEMKFPVMLKRGLCATIEEWLMSAEYLLSSGAEQVILCERGIRTYEKATRNTLDLSAIPVLRTMTHLPVIVDPSHAVGVRDKVSPMALAAVAAGADGIIVEVHNNPEKALSDGPQALLPEMFDKLMHDIEAMSPVLGKSVVHIRRDVNVLEKKSDKSVSGKIVCAYNGIRGTYAEQAVNRYFDGEAEAKSVPSFKEIFKAVMNGDADYGMVPIENSLGGSVYDNYDNLTRFEDVSIVGALSLRIQHALLAPKGATIHTIKRVYSHPQGFAQCVKMIEDHKWEKITASSTATAAKMVSDACSKENAAIASAITAKYYNLEILQEDIQDDPRDYTRFVVIAANHVQQKSLDFGKSPNVISFVFCTENETGALYNALGVFQRNKLNLTRLESRPIKGQPWHYWFYADASLENDEQKTNKYVQSVINELKSVSEHVRVLGVYSEAEQMIKN